MQLINGKGIADNILSKLKSDIDKSGSIPGLAVVLVGDDKASHIYVELKEKAAQEVGIKFEKFLFSEEDGEEKIISKIKELNNDENFHGIIVQLPLPEKFNTNKIISVISPRKDADGFRENSLSNDPVFPSAIMKMVESVKNDSKNAAVITKSEKFGKSMQESLKRNEIKSEYIFCDKINEEDLKKYDTVVTACGMPGLIKNNMVKNGAIIIDGGIKKEGKKVLGDVDIKSFSESNCFISPVPGGVGPVTVACLLESVYKLSLK